ncbi:MAG: phage holin family protein [Porphyrobacter sp.]|nr:phage holin family protein [Porphyrobacter sp.]
MHDTDPGLALPTDTAPADPALTSKPTETAEGATGFTALRDEVTALVEDARTYAEAEVAFQKTRASLAGKHGARALVMLVLALVLLHIALIALAVGAVIALAPLVTIWGAIAIVVGVMLIGVALLVHAAQADGKLLGAMFGSGEAQ